MQWLNNLMPCELQIMCFRPLSLVSKFEVQKGEKVEENMKYAYKGSKGHYVSMLSLNSNNITHGF